MWVVTSDGLWALVVTEDAQVGEAALRRLGVRDIVTCLASDLRQLQDAPELTQLTDREREQLCALAWWDGASMSDGSRNLNSKTPVTEPKRRRRR